MATKIKDIPPKAYITGYRIKQEAKGEVTDNISQIQIDIGITSFDIGAEKFSELISDLRVFLKQRNDRLSQTHHSLDNTSGYLTNDRN